MVPILTRLILLFVLLFPFTANARTFKAEGSDLLIGVGAEQMALGGAAAATTDDIYSIFWNPAGLSELKESQFSISKQINSSLSPINFLALSLVSDRLNFFGLKTTLSFAWISRLHASATGAFKEDELESIFLRYALPGIPGNFDGEIESKTKDYRLSWALTPIHHPKWSFAFSVSRIECGTAFCGVTANDPGNVIISSSNATAFSFHFGAKYYYNDALTFGLNVEDIDTKLDVDITTTDKTGTTKTTYVVPLPRDIAIGVMWQTSPEIKLSLDYQWLSGSYGEYEILFKVLRGGFSYKSDWLTYRAGLIAPLALESNKIENLKDKLPFPLVPTVGVGWVGDHFKLDFVLYLHPLMSHNRNKPYPTMDISVIYRF